MDAFFKPHDISTFSDEDLSVMVQRGNKEMFGVLIERYEKKFIRYGKQFLSNPENITDLLQDIFMKAYENIKEFDHSRNFSAWIYRIAHNTFVNALKKQQGNRMVLVDFDTFGAHPVYEDPKDQEKEEKEIRAILEGGLEKIDLKYKEVIILHYFEELGYKEISEILHIPLGTVSIRLKRARTALKEAYEQLQEQKK